MANKNFEPKKLRPILLFIMLLGLSLSWYGMRGIPSIPYRGYQVSSIFKVVQLDPSGPAALAGLQLGDIITEVNGIPTEKQYELAHQPDPKIGDITKLIVQRAGMSLDFRFKCSPLPVHQATLIWIYQIAAIFMLVGGLLVFWRKPQKETLLFFLSNYCIALGLMNPPHLGSFLLRNLVAMNSLLFVIFGLAFFLHLTVIFPKPKLSVIETPVEIFIYFPVPLMTILYLALLLFQPWADLRLNQTLHYLYGISVLYCLGLALAAVVHSFWTAKRTAMAQQWTWLLVGVILGVLPPAILVFRNSFLPGLPLPGGSYFDLMILFAYFSFSWALLRRGPTQDSDRIQQVA